MEVTAQGIWQPWADCTLWDQTSRIQAITEWVQTMMPQIWARCPDTSMHTWKRLSENVSAYWGYLVSTEREIRWDIGQLVSLASDDPRYVQHFVAKCQNYALLSSHLYKNMTDAHWSHEKTIAKQDLARIENNLNRAISSLPSRISRGKHLDEAFVLQCAQAKKKGDHLRREIVILREALNVDDTLLYPTTQMQLSQAVDRYSRECLVLDHQFSNRPKQD